MVVLWVSPPAWVQTQRSETALEAGAALDAPVVVVTGHGGSASLRVGGSDIVLSPGTIWQLQSKEAGTGNVMQGGMNSRRLLGDAGAAPADAQRCDGKWVLRIGPAADRADAARMTSYLNRAGYSAHPGERTAAGDADRWWLSLPGYAHAAGALEAGRRLTVAVPGVTRMAVEEAPTDAGCPK